MPGTRVFGGAHVIDAGLIELPNDAVLASRQDLHLEDYGIVLAEYPQAIGHVGRRSGELDVFADLGLDAL
jgi:hypothetical protein